MTRGVRFDEQRLRTDYPSMNCAARGVMVVAATVLLSVGCGGRYSRDEEASAGAGRASTSPEGGAPNAGGGGSGPSSAAGSASAGAPSAGAPSAGAPSAGASSACQGTTGVPPRMPGNHKPQNVSGKYQLVTCGQATPCIQVGDPLTTRTLSDPIVLTVLQDTADLSSGTVSLHGTGELLLDDRAFPAKFRGRSFEVQLSGPINAVCGQEYDLSFSYAFDGDGPRTFDLYFERSPLCSGNSGSESCKGRVHSTFGDALPVLE